MNAFFSRALILKFFKFAAVGFTGVAIDFCITWFFKEVVKIQRFIANAIGFCAAATSNYFLNRYWTFQSQNPEMLWEYTKFFLISLIGLGINTLILWILVTRYRKKFYVAKLFAIGVVMVWNFLMNLGFTFV